MIIKRLKYFFIIFILISLVTSSLNIQANTPNKNLENEKSKPSRFGFIYGRIQGRFDFQFHILRFAKLEFENRKTWSGFFGYYIIGFLQIGKTYEITATKNGWNSVTQEVTLTKENPIQRINFILVNWGAMGCR
jgi:hypothetical protein